MLMEVDSSPASTLVVCGANESSQLGCEAADVVPLPIPVALRGVHVAAVAFGLCHALWLSDEGIVHAMGLNDVGQCGVSAPDQLGAPVRLDTLSTRRTVQVRAGGSFSVVISEQFEVLAFGANDFGQCGQGEGAALELRKPRLLKSVPPTCDASCGGEHLLLLDRQAAVHACGQGAHGALGLGDTVSRAAPERLSTLAGSGVRQVGCGDAHSVALTFGGRVFAWGSRRHGALGLPLAAGELVALPRQVPGLGRVAALACGGGHTLALLGDGRVFAWGKGDEGALGVAGGAADRQAPSAVALPPDAAAVAVAAGSGHSLALLGDGRVLAWGAARCGQLGAAGGGLGLVDAPTPVAVQLPAGGGGAAAAPTAVAAGGHSTALVLGGAPPPAAAPPTLSAEAVQRLCAAARWAELGGAVEAVFASPALLAASYGAEAGGAQHAALEASYVALLGAFGAAPALLDAVHASLPRLLDGVEALLDDLAAAPSGPASPLRGGGGASGAPPALQRGASLGGRGPLASALALPLLALLQNPLLSHETHAAHLARAAAAVDAAPAACRALMVESLAGGCPREVFASRLVRPAAAALERALQPAAGRAPLGGEVVALARWLGLLRDASRRAPAELVPAREFYSAFLSERLDVRRDYETWATHGPCERGAAARVPWSFCSEPWLFDAAAKARLLKVEAELRMSQSVQQAARFAAAGGRAAADESVLLPAKRRCGASEAAGGRAPYFADAREAAASPYLVLRVRRAHLVADCLDALAEQSVVNLLKPLRVIFHGEPAIDEGGVRKEFFQLLLEQLFLPEYGLWTYDAATRRHWFPRGGGVAGEAEYFLVGLVIGLALHNALILELRLPPLLYRRLLNEPVGLRELGEVEPDVAKGLALLLAHEGGDVAETFCLDFAIEERSLLGEVSTHELLPGGAALPVTEANRAEYARLYAERVLVGGVKAQFDAFQRGFLLLCDGPALSFLSPSELEELACGETRLDLRELRRATRYDGFTATDQAVQWFWEVADEYTVDEKKALLHFATGCDRAPIGGLAKLQFVLQRSGPDSLALPTAHTCFNLLSMPAYGSRGKLRDRLGIAIHNAVGFGLQ